MNVAGILKDHAKQHPTDDAMIDRHRGRSRHISYRELENAAGRVATLLVHTGLRPGDTVLVFHPMSNDLYVAIAALLRLGLVAMFVDPSAGRHYIDRCCQLRPPRAMIAANKAHLLRLLSSELRRIPLKFCMGGLVPGASSLQPKPSVAYRHEIFDCTADFPALVSFTSGSTGQPKATLRSHGFLLAQHHAVQRDLELVPQEIELIALPVFVLANLASRVTSILPCTDLRRPDAVDPAPVITQLQQHRATRVAAAPAFYERIADYCERHRIVLPRLTKVLTGGGPVTPRLLLQLQRIAPQAKITVVYGSTEAEPICRIALNEMQSSDLAAMFGGGGLLVGRPVAGLQLRIVKDRWGQRIGPCIRSEYERLCQPPGEPGEIIVSGQHVLSSYVQQRCNDENKVYVEESCWHRTGDAGYIDPSGRLWLVGRCAARITDQRGEFYPLGVESAALRCDFVRRAAFTSSGGKRVLAVELRSRALQPSLDGLLKSLSFAGVDAIHVVKKLPVDKRHNTKIDYAALQEMLS